MVFERRNCSLTGIPIASSDRASVQVTLAKLNEYGQATGEIEIFDISGTTRRQGIADGMLYDLIYKQE